MSENSKTYGRRDWLVGGAVFALGLVGIFFWQVTPTPTPLLVSKLQPFDEVTASVICREAIRRTSRDPEKADVPMVRSIQTDRTIFFQWSAATSLARLRNGLGLEVGVEAVCVANRDTRSIQSLVVNGKTHL